MAVKGKAGVALLVTFCVACAAVWRRPELLAASLGAWTGRGSGELQLADATSRRAGRSLQQVQAAAVVEAVPQLPTTPGEHCALAKGTWCGGYYRQIPEPRLPYKRGDTDCPNDCNGVGNCDYDTGRCYCPAGWGGEGCTEPRKRPCFHMGPDKRDLDVHGSHWAHSRCGGYCDDDVSMCYCPPETKYGRIDAPVGSPPGTRAIKMGRPLYLCFPDKDSHGKNITWGNTPYDHLLGPNGWCNADTPQWHCPCRTDGVLGELCNIAVEHSCYLQCTGHGDCYLGFCKCYDGWYGNDCSKRRAGLPYEEGDEVSKKPWLQPVVPVVVAAQDPPVEKARLRPYIYMYEMNVTFLQDIMQYRIERSHCVYREFGHRNATHFVGYYAYSVEAAMYEMFATSAHRTYDPEEADFFFVPVLSNCFFDVYGWNPIPKWPSDVHGPRPYGAANMQRVAVQWMNETFPYFNRRGGRDHIWLNLHDEGACYVFKEVWPGIMLTHWGRMDFPHASHTSYTADNYSVVINHPTHPGDWQDVTSKAHPCYDPKKDLVIPTWKIPASYQESPFYGKREPAPRGMKTFFRGDVGKFKHDPEKACLYSRCLRQRLYNISREGGWREKYGFYYGSRDEIPGEFSLLISNATFCLVMPGEGWGHPEDGALQGCIPVIIMDDVHQPFESIFDYDTFSVRVAQKDLPRLAEILEAYTPEQIAEMRSNLAKIWFRFRYNSLKMTLVETRSIVRTNMEANGGVLRKVEGIQYADTSVDDAFSTIIQWLYSRIPDVHGPGAKLPKEEGVADVLRAAGATTTSSSSSAAAAQQQQQGGAAGVLQAAEGTQLGAAIATTTTAATTTTGAQQAQGQATQSDGAAAAAAAAGGSGGSLGGQEAEVEGADPADEDYGRKGLEDTRGGGAVQAVDEEAVDEEAWAAQAEGDTSAGAANGTATAAAVGAAVVGASGQVEEGAGGARAADDDYGRKGLDDGGGKAGDGSVQEASSSQGGGADGAAATGGDGGYNSTAAGAAVQDQQGALTLFDDDMAITMEE